MRLDLFVLTALAVYRVWRLIARDKITERRRETLYNRWPPTYARSLGEKVWNEDMRELVFRAREPASGWTAPQRKAKLPKRSWLASAVACPWCSGAWLAAGAVAVVDAHFGLPWPIGWWLALSTAVGLLGQVDG